MLLLLATLCYIIKYYLDMTGSYGDGEIVRVNKGTKKDGRP